MVTEAQIRSIANEQPEVVEKSTWGHPTFRREEHIFVGVDEKVGSATIRATPEVQQALIAEHPETYGVAPRVGRHGWVSVDLEHAEADDLRGLIADAWELAA